MLLSRMVFSTDMFASATAVLESYHPNLDKKKSNEKI